MRMSGCALHSAPRISWCRIIFAFVVSSRVLLSVTAAHQGWTEDLKIPARYGKLREQRVAGRDLAASFNEPSARKLVEAGCNDQHTACSMWAQQGYCNVHVEWQQQSLLAVCRKSCGTCNYIAGPPQLQPIPEQPSGPATPPSPSSRSMSPRRFRRTPLGPGPPGLPPSAPRPPPPRPPRSRASPPLPTLGVYMPGTKPQWTGQGAGKAQQPGNAGLEAARVNQKLIIGVVAGSVVFSAMVVTAVFLRLRHTAMVNARSSSNVDQQQELGRQQQQQRQPGRRTPHTGGVPLSVVSQFPVRRYDGSEKAGSKGNAAAAALQPPIASALLSRPADKVAGGLPDWKFLQPQPQPQPRPRPWEEPQPWTQPLPCSREGHEPLTQPQPQPQPWPHSLPQCTSLVTALSGGAAGGTLVEQRDPASHVPRSDAGVPGAPALQFRAPVSTTCSSLTDDASTAPLSEPLGNTLTQQAECAICLASLEAGDMLRELPCHHEFHQKCIDGWMRSRRTCPLCRHVLYQTQA